MTKSKINWKQMWEDFDNWLDTFTPPKCPTCSNQSYDDVDWYKQQEKIQEPIDQQLGNQK